MSTFPFYTGELVFDASGKLEAFPESMSANRQTEANFLQGCKMIVEKKLSSEQINEPMANMAWLGAVLVRHTHPEEAVILLHCADAWFEKNHKNPKTWLEMVDEGWVFDINRWRNMLEIRFGA